MIFFILTREGFDQLRQRSGAIEPVQSPIWVNQGVLSSSEINELERSGDSVTVIANRIDPHSPSAIESVVNMIRARHAGKTVWVEHAAPSEEAGLKRWPFAASSTPVAKERAIGAPALVSPSWRQALRSVLSQLDTVSDRVRHYLHQTDASPPGLTIIPYHGYATAEKIAVSGRVLRNHTATPAQPGDTRWRNFRALVGMMKSDEVAGARVRARFGEAEHEAVANDEGFFHLDIPLATSLTTPDISPGVALELIEPRPSDGAPVTAVATVSLPPASAKFGIISDIDDTVLWTNVTNRLNMLLMLAGSNVHTRKPFRGVAAFYAALRDGAAGNENNPVFYVSSSPWNLYTPLTEFMRLQDIPLGPLFLKDLGEHTIFGANDHHSHKLDAIERILDAYPHLPFVLIGDSGEQDPEIYSRVVHDYPQRVRAIYIRNINPDPSRIDAIDHLIDEVGKSGAQLVLAPDSEFAAAHAAGEGLIRFEAVAEVRAAKRDDGERSTAS